LSLSVLTQNELTPILVSISGPANP